MEQTLWLLALAAKLSLSARLLLSDTLRKRYTLLATWVVGESIGSIVLMGIGGDPHQMNYAVVWAWVEVPIMALRALAVGELMVSLIRQYGAHNRRFLCGFSGFLAVCAVGFSVASVVWLECSHFRPGNYPWVQGVIVSSRVFALAAALVLSASIALMLRYPLPAFNRNCAIQRNSLAVFFALMAVERYAVLALIPIRYSTLDRIGVAILIRDIALWAWLAYAVRPSLETDFVPVAPNGYYNGQRRIDVAITRGLRAAWRRFRRALTGADRLPVF